MFFLTKKEEPKNRIPLCNILIILLNQNFRKNFFFVIQSKAKNPILMIID